MKKILPLLLFAALLLACNKDRFETVPAVRILEFGPSEVNKGQLFRVRAEITDKEGDIADTVTVVQKRFNGNNLLTTDTIARLSLKQLNVPQKRRAELQITFAYGEQLENTILVNQERIDIGFVIGLIVRDQAKNRSQYVETRRIVLKRV